LVLNKADLVDPAVLVEKVDVFRALVAHRAYAVISAKEGGGIRPLLTELTALLPEGPRYYPKDQLSEVNLRFIAAETVREKILLNTFEEIPHAVAVGIDSFEEQSGGNTIIHATIYVEKDSQKGIIVGSGGAMIKKIGTQARTELSKTFDQRVQLFLHVKVLKNWRSDARLMRQFGYFTPTDDES
jgi:GTP-binding protein Era